MRRRYSETGQYGRIAVKKPLIRKQNNVKRLQKAKVHKDGTIEKWNKVLWTRESKFEIFGSNLRIYVQRIVGKRAATPCITSTVKYRESSVMVWGSFANCKIRDLHQVKDRLNQTGYHRILQHHVILSGMWLVGHQGFVLMQDNDPKYTCQLKEEQRILQLTSWLVQSADLNPIKLVWNELH